MKSNDLKIKFSADHQLKHQKIITKIPDDLTFAGEEIHFKTPDAYLKYYKELKVNTENNSSTRLLLRNVSVLLPVIEKILVENHIPNDFKYVAVAESNLNNNVVSHKGAAGIWQFTDITAQDYGLEVNDEVDERYHLQKSTYAAAKYFKQSYNLFGSWTSAAASYNRGIGGLQKAFLNQSVNSYYDLALNRETAKYIYRILALKDLISAPKKYKMKHPKFRMPQYQFIRIDTSIEDLEQFAKTIQLDYNLLKDYNPWLLSNTLTIKKPNDIYFITVPVNFKIMMPEIADTNRSRILNGVTKDLDYIKTKLYPAYNI